MNELSELPSALWGRRSEILMVLTSGGEPAMTAKSDIQALPIIRPCEDWDDELAPIGHGLLY
jgi:hypothetical protein